MPNKAKLLFFIFLSSFTFKACGIDSLQVVRTIQRHHTGKNPISGLPVLPRERISPKEQEDILKNIDKDIMEEWSPLQKEFYNNLVVICNELQKKNNSLLLRSRAQILQVYASILDNSSYFPTLPIVLQKLAFETISSDIGNALYKKSFKKRDLFLDFVRKNHNITLKELLTMFLSYPKETFEFLLESSLVSCAEHMLKHFWKQETVDPFSLFITRNTNDDLQRKEIARNILESFLSTHVENLFIIKDLHTSTACVILYKNFSSQKIENLGYNENNLGVIQLLFRLHITMSDTSPQTM